MFWHLYHGHTCGPWRTWAASCNFPREFGDVVSNSCLHGICNLQHFGARTLQHFLDLELRTFHFARYLPHLELEPLMLHIFCSSLKLDILMLHDICSSLELDHARSFISHSTCSILELENLL